VLEQTQRRPLESFKLSLTISDRGGVRKVPGLVTSFVAFLSRLIVVAMRRVQKNESRVERNIEPSLGEAILSLHATVPLMEKHAVDIWDLRERLAMKEQEMNDAISQTKAVLSLVKNHMLDGTRGGELDHHLLKTLVDSDWSEAETATQPLGVDMTRRVADLSIKQRKESLTLTQRAAEEALVRTREEQNRVAGEIVDSERDMKLLKRAIEVSKGRLEGCFGQHVTLNERRCSLERELTALGLKYCEMNEALLAQSAKESNLILRSIRDDPNAQQGLILASPLLRKYVGVATELAKSVSMIQELSVRMNEFREEESNREVLALAEKVSCHRETLRSLATVAVQLMSELKECESQCEGLEALKGDLIAAMRWAQLESGGLYQPCASSAPLVLLLFQQSCRQQVSSGLLTPKRGELMTVDRLRRYGCSAYHMKATGYSINQLLAGGYSVHDMRATGLSAQDLRFSKITISDLKEAGYTPCDLRLAGYPLISVKAAKYSVHEILREGAYTLCDIAQCGDLPFYEMKQIGYTARDLKEKGGFSVRQLREIHYSVQEIQEAGYTLEEMREAMIPEGQLRGVSRQGRSQKKGTRESASSSS
jgi:hypothetical protein